MTCLCGNREVVTELPKKTFTAVCAGCGEIIYEFKRAG